MLSSVASGERAVLLHNLFSDAFTTVLVNRLGDARTLIDELRTLRAASEGPHASGEALRRLAQMSESASAERESRDMALLNSALMDLGEGVQQAGSAVGLGRKQSGYSLDAPTRSGRTQLGFSRQGRDSFSPVSFEVRLTGPDEISLKASGTPVWVGAVGDSAMVEAAVDAVAAAYFRAVASGETD